MINSIPFRACMLTVLTVFVGMQVHIIKAAPSASLSSVSADAGVEKRKKTLRDIVMEEDRCNDPEMRFDNPKFKIPEPSNPVMPVLGGAAVGVVIALALTEGKDIYLNIGALLGALCGGYSHFSYQKLYNASNGLDLRGAAAADNADGVLAHLNNGEKADKVDKDNCLPLHYAAANNGLSVAPILLDNMQVHDAQRELTPVKKTETDVLTVDTLRTIDIQDARFKRTPIGS